MKKHLKQVVLILGVLLIAYVITKVFALRALFMAILVQCGARPIPLLIQGLNAQGEDDRMSSIAYLAKFGTDSIPALIEALQAKDSRTREGAAMALGAMADWRFEPGRQDPKEALNRLATHPLLERLEDTDPRVRVKAALALWHIQKEAAVVMPTLLRAVYDDDPDVRYYAWDGIEKIRTAGVSSAIEASQAFDEIERKRALGAGLRKLKGAAK